MQGKILLDDVQQEYLFMQLGERAAMGNTAPGRLANGKSSSASKLYQTCCVILTPAC